MLYGCYRSRATRPLWVLHETGLPFTLVPVVQANRVPDPVAPDARVNTRTPSFLAVNPQGQIPALEDDGLVLTESLAIALHIARKSGPVIGPDGLAEESEAVNWALVAATAIEPPAVEILYAAMGGKLGTAEGDAALARAAEALARPLSRLEVHLARRDWLMGGRFTVADIVVAECVRYAQLHPTLLAGYPAVDALIRRCQARPAFKAMMEARNAEVA